MLKMFYDLIMAQQNTAGARTTLHSRIATEVARATKAAASLAGISMEQAIEDALRKIYGPKIQKKGAV
jgi:hypothetical protein